MPRDPAPVPPPPPEAAAPVLGVERIEVASSGFDDFLGTLGADYPGGLPIYFGLRIPSFVPAAPYVFLGAACDLDVGDRLVGFRQYLSIAALIGQSPPPSDVPDALPAPPGAPLVVPSPLPPVFVRERPIVTPGWHPPFGWASWHLRIEQARNVKFPRGTLDQWSFIWRDSKGPALLYNTAGFPSPQLMPGYLGLDAYSPPPLRGKSLFVAHDIRNPWQSDEFQAIGHVSRVPERALLYIVVQQTPPIVYPALTLDDQQLEFAAESLVPEDSFCQAFASSDLETPALVQYHRCAASLVVDRYRRRTSAERG